MDLPGQNYYRYIAEQAMEKQISQLQSQLLEYGMHPVCAQVLSRHTNLAREYIGMIDNITKLELTPDQRKVVMETDVPAPIYNMVKVVNEVIHLRGETENPLKPYEEDTEALEHIINTYYMLQDKIIRTEGDLMIVKALNQLSFSERDFYYAKELFETKTLIDEISGNLDYFADQPDTFASMQNELATFQNHRHQLLQNYRSQTLG